MTILKKRPLRTVALGALLVGAISCGGSSSDAATDAAGGASAGGSTSGGSSSGGSSSQSFALTANPDSIVGTSGNDTVTAPLVGLNFNVASWAAGDSIDGGAGEDTVNAFLNGNVSGAALVRVEKLLITASAASVVDLSAGADSLTTIGTNNSTNTVTVNNVPVKIGDSSFELTNNAVGAGALTVTLADAALTGTSDSATIKLNNVSTATINIGPVVATNGYETFTVASNGSVKNGLTTDLVLNDGVGTTLTAVNFTGNQTLDIDFTPTTVTKVDASAMTMSAGTAGLDVQFAAANGQNLTVTGTPGDDIIDVQGYTTADVINCGLGTDHLVLTSAESSGASTTTQSNITNCEVVKISGAAAAGTTHTVASFGAKGYRLDGTATAGALTLSYPTLGSTGGTLDLQNSTGGGALTVNVAGSATDDVMNMNMGSTAAGNAFGQNIVFTGVETVNLTTQGGAVSAAAWTLPNALGTQKLNVSGSQSFTLTGALTADEFNCSGLTGSASCTMASAAIAALVTGSANADTLIGSTSADQFIGGAGADSITNTVTGANATAGDTIATGAGYDTVTLIGDAASATDYSGCPNISDYTVGLTATTTDLIRLSSANTDYVAGLSDGAAAQAATGAVGVLVYSQGTSVASTAAGTAELIKLPTSTAFTTDLATTGAAAFGGGTITVTAAGTFAGIFHDSTNNKMVIFALTSADTSLTSADTFRCIGTVDMTAADYANIDTDNFASFL